MTELNNRAKECSPPVRSELTHKFSDQGNPAPLGQHETQRAMPNSPSYPADEEWVDPRARAQATRAAKARHSNGRTGKGGHASRDTIIYSNEELEFMMAMEDYKQKSGRKFPTWCEIFEVLQSLGYQKPPQEANENDSP